MKTLEKIKHLNVVEKEDITLMSYLLYESISIKRAYKSEHIVDSKEEILNIFTSLFEKVLTERSLLSKKDKINVIHFIDKLNTQKENLEIIKGNILTKDIKAASKRLGKKSQSAFEIL